MSTDLPKLAAPEINNGALREPIPSTLLGTATLDKTGEFEAGSYQSTRVDNDRVRAMDLASVDALVEVSELILLRVSF